MTCADFEHRLTQLLADEIPHDDRDALADELQRHAADCAACRATQPLIELCRAPAGERDFVEAPGAAYWEGFNDRVEQRRRLDEQAGKSRQRLGSLAAALFLAALVGSWWVKSQFQDAVVLPITELIAAQLEINSPHEPLELSEELDALLRGVAEGGQPTDLEVLAGLVEIPSFDSLEVLSREQLGDAWSGLLDAFASTAQLNTEQQLGWYEEAAALWGAGLVHGWLPDTTMLAPAEQRELIGELKGELRQRRPKQESGGAGGVS